MFIFETPYKSAVSYIFDIDQNSTISNTREGQGAYCLVSGDQTEVARLLDHESQMSIKIMLNPFLDPTNFVVRRNAATLCQMLSGVKLNKTKDRYQK